MKFDDLSNKLISCAIAVHRELSPGLLESTYEQCLAYELSRLELAGVGVGLLINCSTSTSMR